MPELIKYQILSFMRIEWPQGFTGRWRGRRWISRPEFNPHHFVLLDNDFVIGHAESMWRDWGHNDIVYRVYGISGVFIYPDYQGEGYGKQLVQAATDYCKAQPDADLGMVWREPHLEDFYTQCGWEPMPTTTTLIGETRDSAQVDDERLLMFFNSEKGRDHRHHFEDNSVYFGWTTW